MMSGEVYLHDRAGLRDMHVRRRVVERVAASALTSNDT